MHFRNQKQHHKIIKSSARQSTSQQLLIDPTKTYGKVASFGKQARFKKLQKQQLKTSDIEWPQNTESVLLEPRKYSFSKKERFQIQKPKYVQTPINPDINVVKKNNKNNVPIYKSPSKQLNDSKISISTVDSQTFRAPGLYNPRQSPSKVKNGAFAKDNRFKQEKNKYNDIPLMINENQTKKRPPLCPPMKPKTIKTKQLISKERQEQLRQKLKFIYWKSIPLQLDRIFKNTNGPVMRQNYFQLSRLRGTQKRCALLMMMDRLNYIRGGFQQEISTKMQEAPCGVVYRRSTPKPFKFSQMQPGPDYYYPQDDYLKPSPVAFSFAREGLKPKIQERDYRDYEIKEEIMKKGGNVVINPVHRQHRLTQEEMRALSRGPGFYDCVFKLVQERTDKGNVGYQPVNDKNDRQNNCIEIPQVNDGIYFVSYNAVDPNVAVPLLKPPTEIKPAHLPDKILFPEHWLFYDGDLNKVRAQIAKNVLLAKNMSFSQYNTYKTKFNRFKQYLQLQKKGPEVGEYQVQYKAIDAHVEGYEFGKQEEKKINCQGIRKEEGDVQGDNLVLRVEEPKKHVAQVDFGKMEGRNDKDVDQEQPKIGDRLILNPTKPQKHVPAVNFQKQQARPSLPQPDLQSPPQGDILILNPKQPKPHIPQIDMARQAQRVQIVTQQDPNLQVNILNPRQIDEGKVKGAVPFSRLSSVRIIPILREKGKDKLKHQEQWQEKQQEE